MKDLQTLRLFARVARLGSFSAAAREGGLVQSQVSRMIAELEAGLGTRLLSRTTRSVAPTDAGLEFLARIEPALAAIEDAGNSVRETGELRGLLRISMPATMGMRVVMPRLAAFTEQHPLLRIEMLLDDAWRDLTREAVDVGIRVGQLPDAAGTRRFIGLMHRVFVAAPRYIARHGLPETPSDLERHRIIIGPVAPNARTWQFERDGTTMAVDVQPVLSVNDTAGALAAASNGLGITPTTSWACRRELESGELVQVLADWKGGQFPVHAYFPMGRTTRIAARAFVDFIAAELHSDPPQTQRSA